MFTMVQQREAAAATGPDFCYYDVIIQRSQSKLACTVYEAWLIVTELPATGAVENGGKYD
jgi:hypothetical protein